MWPTVPSVRLLYGVLVDNAPFAIELGTPEGAHVKKKGEQFVYGQVVARRAVRVKYVHGGRTTICHNEVPVRRVGTFYVFPNRSICLWAICVDGMGELPFLPSHGPTMKDVRETDRLLLQEIPGVAIQRGQISGSMRTCISVPCAACVYY